MQNFGHRQMGPFGRCTLLQASKLERIQEKCVRFSARNALQYEDLEHVRGSTNRERALVAAKSFFNVNMSRVTYEGTCNSVETRRGS